MPKIHFASVFGVDYDSDLLYQWLSHYLKFGFDTYKLFFHTNHENLDDSFRASFTDDIKRKYDNRIDCEFIPGTPEFRAGNVRNKCMKEYVNTLHASDYLVTADSDEFQDMDDTGYRNIILSHDCVCGTLVDRWGDSLCSLSPEIPIHEQYPYAGNFYASIGHRFATSDDMCFFGRYKIMAHRVHMPVNFLGSHILEGSRDGKIPDTYKQSGGHRIYHYSFRSTFIKRMYDRYYYTSDDVYQVLKAFNMHDSHWVKMLEERERKRHEEMGWIPSSQEG